MQSNWYYVCAERDRWRERALDAEEKLRKVKKEKTQKHCPSCTCPELAPLCGCLPGHTHNPRTGYCLERGCHSCTGRKK